MAYIVKMFDGLLVPEYIQPGDRQDIGSGSALTSFLSLPGGGFYDNYRDRKSPQGIRPISKSGVFWGTASELETQLDAWRAKLGVRGRLTVEFDTGDLRWQWARLRDVSAPRPSNAKGGWLPFTLTWITAAQNWRKSVYGSEWWAWGDGLWVFGDGSAEFGIEAPSFNVATSGTLCTVTHNGSIDAANVTLRFEMTGTWQDLTVVNQTTGQQIILDRDSAEADSTPWLEIDAGARAIYRGGTQRNITTAYRSQNTVYVNAAGHGLATDDAVRIENNGVYDGDFYPVTVSDSNNFYFDLPPRHAGYGTTGIVGTMRPLWDAYNLTTFSDRERWLVLAPGDNVLEVIWNDAPSTATMTVEYVDHYA